MNESKLRENYKNIQNNTFKEITKILKNNNYDVYNNLSDFIASIFNVDRSDMLSKSLDRDICRARWMLWAALYNFYEKTYEEIAAMTGLSSRIALRRRPLASSGVDGATTLRPGTCAYQPSMLWLCWALS